MPNLISDASLLRAFSCLEPFPSAVLAVSGGPDSMALMALSKRWLDLTATSQGAVTVATADHGLRPESKEEAAFVAARARDLGFSHTTLAWIGEKPKTGIQAAARRARYDLLVSHALSTGAACIVMAHTEDDQAETLLMRLRRGSGVDGLAAMAAVTERGGVAIVRPLLGFSKGRLMAYLRACRIPFVRDPSNDNAAFERVRLRHATKALAAAGITRSFLARSAMRLNRSREALVTVTEDFLDRHFQVTPLAEGKVSQAALAAVPEDIALRAVGRIVSLVGGGIEPPQLAKIEQLFSKPGLHRRKITLGGCIVIAASGTLNFYREPGRLRGSPIQAEPGTRHLWDHRFILAFGPATQGGMAVRPLGAYGWLFFAKAMKEQGLSSHVNRLAALTTPALWDGNRLLCAPLLNFSAPGGNHDVAGKLVEATLARGLARFLAATPGGAASVLGKDKPIPYL